MTDEQEPALAEAMAESRAALIEAVDELRLTARARLSPAERIRQDPVPWLLGGFVLGFLLGSRR